MNQYILVTGGAGYIGSHMAGMLVDAGYRVIVFDDLSTGVRAWVPKKAVFIKGNLLEKKALKAVFKKYPIKVVVHFAAKIVVPESMLRPQWYYYNNVGGTSNLLSCMVEHYVRQIIFSSTAAVYGNPSSGPVTEGALTLPLNPYGSSKLWVEKILNDMAKAGTIDYIILRYFNVAGWDNSRNWPMKERPAPTHLIANVINALNGQTQLKVCGNDYKTPDGTGVRDYIHVKDLCAAHLLAIKALQRGIKNRVFNLGNSKGFSVMDIIQAASKIAEKPVPYKIGPKRPGDVALSVASSAKIRKMLGWKPRYDLQEILNSEWEKRKGL